MARAAVSGLSTPLEIPRLAVISPDGPTTPLVVRKAEAQLDDWLDKRHLWSAATSNDRAVGVK